MSIIDEVGNLISSNTDNSWQGYVDALKKVYSVDNTSSLLSNFQAKQEEQKAKDIGAIRGMQQEYGLAGSGQEFAGIADLMKNYSQQYNDYKLNLEGNQISQAKEGISQLMNASQTQYNRQGDVLNMAYKLWNNGTGMDWNSAYSTANQQLNSTGGNVSAGGSVPVAPPVDTSSLAAELKSKLTSANTAEELNSYLQDAKYMKVASDPSVLGATKVLKKQFTKKEYDGAYALLRAQLSNLQADLTNRTPESFAKYGIQWGQGEGDLLYDHAVKAQIKRIDSQMNSYINKIAQLEAD